MKRALHVAVALFAFGLPSQVLACPVCSAGRDDKTQAAFFSMTIFMTLLPLTAFGAVVYWFVRRARELDVQQPHELAPSAEE